MKKLFYLLLFVCQTIFAQREITGQYAAPLKINTKSFFEAPPYVEFVWKTTESIVYKEITQIELTIVSNKIITFDNIQVYQNGNLISGQKLGEVQLKPKDNSYYFSNAVALNEGENMFEVKVNLQKNKATFVSKTITINYQKAIIKPFVQVVWSNNNGVSSNSSQEIFTLSATIVSNTPLKKEYLSLLQNNRLLDTKKLGDILFSQQENGYTITQKVLLSEGENNFEIGIEFPHWEGKIQTTALKVNYLPINKPNLYIISIGVKDFNLSYPSQDAAAIVEVFKSQKGRLFQNVYSTLLTSEAETRADFIKTTIAKQKTINDIKEKDVVILFISSHGRIFQPSNGKNDFVIQAINFDYTNIETQEITGVLYNKDILAKLESIKGKKIILFDACYSGQVLLAGGKNSFIGDLSKAQEIISNTPEDIVIISSSSEGERSWEADEWKHGAFTKAILDGLEGKADEIDTNSGKKDGYIYISELFHYIEKTVPQMVKLIKKEAQKPQMDLKKVEGNKDFPIYKY